MSNHYGSHMLNEVLSLIDEKYTFFQKMNKDEVLAFVKDIISIGSFYDCNSGEVLTKIGAKLGICYYCCKYKNNINEYDLCNECK